MGRETATAAVAALREEGPDPELAAAVALARRRRLGPWRASEERAADRQRDLGVLARAGFPADVARKVLDAASEDELLEDLAAEG